MRWLLLGIIVVLMVAGLLWAQQAPSPQDALAQCQSVLRVKTDMQTQAEQLAGVLLRRAERAEQELAEVKKQLEQGKEPASKSP